MGRDNPGFTRPTRHRWFSAIHVILKYKDLQPIEFEIWPALIADSEVTILPCITQISRSSFQNLIVIVNTIFNRATFINNMKIKMPAPDWASQNYAQFNDVYVYKF